MGYPIDHLKTRSVVKLGQYAVISPEGRVVNVIPGLEGFKTTILATPKMGAGFVQYISVVSPGARTTKPFGAENGIETFIYFLDGNGELVVRIGDTEQTLVQGGYAYAPADHGVAIENRSDETMRVLLYKQRYEALDGYRPEIVFGNVHQITERPYDDMANVFIKDLLPTGLGFDMNMHVLSFEPDGCHPFVETHVQEHGAYVTSGQGIYLLGEEWIQVKKEDFIWFGPFIQQGVYATGRERLSYIYSKDCNRDAHL